MRTEHGHWNVCGMRTDGEKWMELQDMTGGGGRARAFMWVRPSEWPFLKTKHRGSCSCS